MSNHHQLCYSCCCPSKCHRQRNKHCNSETVCLVVNLKKSSGGKGGSYEDHDVVVDGDDNDDDIVVDGDDEGANEMQ